MRSLQENVTEVELNNRIDGYLKSYNKLPTLILIDAISFYKIILFSKIVNDSHSDINKSIFKYRSIHVIPVISATRFIHLQQGQLIELCEESVKLKEEMFEKIYNVKDESLFYFDENSVKLDKKTFDSIYNTSDWKGGENNDKIKGN